MRNYVIGLIISKATNSPFGGFFFGVFRKENTGFMYLLNHYFGTIKL